jgi:hypothetical protein
MVDVLVESVYPDENHTTSCGHRHGSAHNSQRKVRRDIQHNYCNLVLP